MIKTLFIDYAGVLTPTANNFVFANKYAEKYGKSSEELMKISYLNWEKTALGEFDSEQFWEIIAKKLATKSETLKFEVMETYPLDKQLVQWLKDLKNEFTLVMVSNQISSWLEAVIEKNELRKIFDFTANSYQAGSRKPDKKIFEYALNVSSSHPEEVLFIDDAKKNIEAARLLGMQALQYSEFENLQSLNLFEKI